MDNETWISRFKTGDEQTFRDVYDAYSTRLRYYASKMLSNDQEAEEVVADTFLKLWDRHTNFSSVEKIKAFIYISIRNHCLDIIKKTKRKAVREQKFRLSAKEPVEVLADERMIQAQLFQVIDREIEKLPAQCKLVFKMGYLEGKTNEEIGLALNISINTVKTQKARALKHLRQSLQNKDLILLLVYLRLCEPMN